MSPDNQHNRRAWDERVLRQDWYIDTATDQDFENPLKVIDPCGWLGGALQNKRVLCLAAGGGRHGVLFASVGASVTVVDLSPRMLELDRVVAAKRNLSLKLIESSMDDLSMLGDHTFDIVVQPVSTCYVPDIDIVYREVARVTVPGGIYISQHKQPVNMQATAAPSAHFYSISESYYRSGPLPPSSSAAWHRESGTLEFLHRWDQLLGSLCNAGFSIEAVTEPRHGDSAAGPGSFEHRSFYIPPYIRLKARRSEASPKGSPPQLWTPNLARL